MRGPERELRVLVARQEITGADRQWAGQYRTGDVVRWRVRAVGWFAVHGAGI